MSYQVYVGFVIGRRRDCLSHNPMSLLIGALFRQQAQPPSDPENVNVYREDRAATREEQSASSSLWADALEAQEKLNGLIKRARAQK